MTVDPLVAQLNKKCLSLVNTIDINNITAVYAPVSDDKNEYPAVRINIPLDNNKDGVVISTFLGAILDSDPKLLTVYSGSNGDYLSYRLKPEGTDKYNSHQVMAEALKIEVIKSIQKYKNASLTEQEKIINNAVAHYNWIDNNNGVKGLSGSEKIKEDIERFGIGPGFGPSAKKATTQR